ncbi:TetR/AcrR family transcriptional regulator [Streptomyces varsoviensis]|uniref:TetR/AcrR family transcriptional regulator n=1 Tax=Streptomyces varsoviensis TaxID=67373 RepID=UPI000689AA79|nr:TetR/AcrR family transcriptional regulator [Streptomyces varsoviensis]
MGLRETKKQQTRQALADAALPLFLEHGFDQVTVADVARHVGVSGQTVFNYFPAKEDLFFDRQAEVEDELARLVREREPGTCPVEAVRDYLLEALKHHLLPFPTAAEGLRFHQVIADSPALLAREREIRERAEAALAAELEAEGDFPAPALLAGAIAGLHRAVLRQARQRLMAGEPGQAEDIAGLEESGEAEPPRNIAEDTRTAFDALCHGFHGR